MTTTSVAARRRLRNTGVYAIVLAGTVTLAGCAAHQSPSAANSPAVSVGSSVASSTPAQSHPTATSKPSQSVYDNAKVTPAPTANNSSSSSALDAAVKVMKTYAQPQVDKSTWLAQMTPLLSQSGALAYQYEDPASIKAHKVLGTPKLLPGSTNVALIVEVPTDVGAYDVSLSRSSSTSPWLADRIKPPTS
jgi:hypothetical protein